MTTEEIRTAIEEKERMIEGQLKDFQLATVRRVADQFRKGHNRILVADEVGLGKTMVAKGVIVEMARIRMLEENDDEFKVIYVCSNQNIANQNISKINIFKGKDQNISSIGSRLSEVHYGLARRKAYKDNRSFVEMTPITPTTSFRVTRGQGTTWERALMFAILSRLEELSDVTAELDKLLRNEVGEGGWEYAKSCYRDEINKIETKHPEVGYPQSVIDTIRKEHIEKIHEVGDFLRGLSSGKKKVYYIGRLRMMFAEISVAELNPDLVIMDEFQRFKFLINNKDSEANVISRRFLSNENDDDPDRRLRVLLLSATPYKLYSTLDEMESDPKHTDEHYTEFRKVMSFLEDGGPDKGTNKFNSIWNEYSEQLHLVHHGGESVDKVQKVKDLAEDAMYQSMCRTERLSVMKSEDYINDSSKVNHLNISDYEINEYIELSQLLKEIGKGKTAPIDYVKSCPYLLSFMHNYEVKRIVNDYFNKHKDKTDMVTGKPDLWLNKGLVRKFRPLPANNARLQRLFEHCFQGKSELFLWVPPTLPYYPLAGVYKGAEGLNFSKVLVFSAWEMVPRMIACLTSYEAERKTVGELCLSKGLKDKAIYDLDRNKRYPQPRMTVKMNDGQPATMSLFSLLYPSKTLASIYSPSEFWNNGVRTLETIAAKLKDSIEKELEPLIQKYGNSSGNGDAWYYMAPIIMDMMHDPEYVQEWIRVEQARAGGMENAKAYIGHLSELTTRIANLENLRLGKMPSDLVDTLVDMALGGFATCIYRKISQDGCISSDATRMAKGFVDRFNTTETLAVVELAFRNNNPEDTHWKSLLRYAKEGCFQSMFDEYYTLIYESIDHSKSSDQNNAAIPEIDATIMQMLEDIDLGTVTNRVEGGKDFKKRINKSEEDIAEKTSMRSHFAMGFSAGSSTDEKKIKTKDGIRHAFNSPLRPFVLASTSIGQEGLDFHLYCRKIMHWNLPSNPIDLEQREGRINRFKCLAIRQNLVKDYGQEMNYSAKQWDDLFNRALADKSPNDPDLVPYWCYNRSGSIKIERILPFYPFSSDLSKYERLIKILSAYRLTLGQARQEELLEYVFQNFSDTDELKSLFFDLCPFSKEKRS